MKQTVGTVAKTPVTKVIEGEPVNLLRRIGSTTYKVTIRFSENATETLEQKMLRVIEREVLKNAV